MDVPSYDFDVLIEKNARKKYSCAMCHEILIYATKTNCNHRFCKYCITKWMMYFMDCPTCGRKLESTAPHTRTDKWIQQLFDLATPEFRQDREMCVNYRKLQQVKMELLGSHDVKSAPTVTKDTLLQEFHKHTEDTQAKGTSLKQDNNNKEDKSKNQCRNQSQLQEDLSVIKNVNVTTKPVTMAELLGENTTIKYAHDIRTLFGVETNSSLNLTDVISVGCSQSSKLHNSNPHCNNPHDLTLNERGDQKSCEWKNNDNDTSSIVSWKAARNTTSTSSVMDGNISADSVTTSRTCHDKLQFNYKWCPGDELVLVQDNDDDGIPEVHGQTCGIGDGKENTSHSGSTQSLNILEAESMRARIQHEIALASLPSLSPARNCPANVFCGFSKQTSRERQDLQTCREALLNLRLRLLPPAKRLLKDKRINADAQSSYTMTPGTPKCTSSTNLPKSGEPTRRNEVTMKKEMVQLHSKGLSTHKF